MDDREKFKENDLLPIEAFYSSLNLFGTGEYDYNHAQRVWREFEMKNLGESQSLSQKRHVAAV